MFLLLLAIADDAGGLVILAIFYPQGALAPAWLLLSLAAAVGRLPARQPPAPDHRRPERRCPLVHLRLPAPSFWPYAVAGALSWYGFQRAGIHPALGLLPIIPAIPHSDIEFGLFAAEEERLPDLLNRMEHGLKPPVEVVLFLFGLANAGVEFSAIGAATWLVMIGLLVGKPLGISLFGTFAARTLGLGLPPGMNQRDLFVVGCVAAIGFTVALFVAGVAFEPGPVQDAAKMGALFSFAASAVAIVAGIVLARREASGRLTCFLGRIDREALATILSTRHLGGGRALAARRLVAALLGPSRARSRRRSTGGRLTEAELRRARERVEPLLRAAEPTLDRLFAAVGGTGCCVLLADAHGIPLERRGAAGDDRTFAGWGLWTGTPWSEDAEGTNGIGTCLVERRALTIHRDQHFSAATPR